MAKFRATQEQLGHLLAVATNASTPRGMGFIHYDPHRKFTKEDFSRPEYGTDYVQGRMVKCIPHKVADGLYEIEEPSPDYQSWSVQYPTAGRLIEAAGLKVEPETETQTSKEI